MTGAIRTASGGTPAFDGAGRVRLTDRRAVGVWIVVAVDVALVLSLFVPGDFPLLTMTISWAVVTALLIGVFALAVVGLQGVLSPLTDRTVDALAGRVRNEVDPGILRASLTAASTEAVRPVSAGTWLRGGAR